MRRILVLAALLALVGGLAQAELSYTKVTANTSATMTTINAGSLTVVNDGASSIYVRVFWEGETTVDSVGTALAATASNAEIKSGEALEFSKELSIKAISIVSASSSTVRLYYW
jgi:hypothetical protein